MNEEQTEFLQCLKNTTMNVLFCNEDWFRQNHGKIIPIRPRHSWLRSELI